MSPGNEPELRDLLEQFRSLRDSVYSSYVAAVERDAPYYELRFAERLLPREWAQENVRTITPPTAYNAVENAHDHVQTTPRIRVPVRPSERNRQREQETAERKRQALRFWWEQVEVEGGDPLSAGVKKQVKDGKVVIKKLVRFDLLPDAEEDPAYASLGEDGFLWEVSAPSPETVFEDPDRPHDPSYVYEAYKIRVGTALRLYPAGAHSWRGKQAQHLVQLVEYWSKPKGDDRGRHVVWIEDEPVVDDPNPYSWATSRSTEGRPDYAGYVPYHVRPSGWGEHHRDGDPEKLYVGMLRRQHSLLDAEAQQATAANAQLMVSTFPMVITYGLTEEQRVEVGPGKRIRLDDPDSQRVEILRWPELPESVFALLAQVGRWSNELTKFEALGGVPLRGVDTATEADSVVRNAAAKLHRPVAHLRSLVAAVNRQVLQDIERVIEQPVTLFGSTGGGGAEVTLGPEDIDGFYANSVQLGTSDQAALDRIEARLWMDAFVRLPGLSEQQVMENIGIEDPYQEQLRREEEEAFRSPEQRQLRTLLSLAALGPAAELIRNSMVRRLEVPEGQQGGPPGGDELSAEARVAATEGPLAPGQRVIQQAQEDARLSRPDLSNA